jgi:hypothetical protein
MMQTRIYLSAIYLLSSVALAQSQDFSRDRAKLEATTVIREQRICMSPSRIPEVDLSVELKFTNVGEFPVILSRNSGESGINVAHTLKRAHAKKYEYKARGDMWDFPFVLQPASPGDSFVILKPHEIYTRNVKVWGLNFESLEQYDHYAAVPHFIRLGLLTVDSMLVSSVSQAGKIDINEKHIRDRWKTYGYLWLDGLDSEPMSIQLPAASTLTDCK